MKTGKKNTPVRENIAMDLGLIVTLLNGEFVGNDDHMALGKGVDILMPYDKLAMLIGTKLPMSIPDGIFTKPRVIQSGWAAVEEMFKRLLGDEDFWHDPLNTERHMNLMHLAIELLQLEQEVYNRHYTWLRAREAASKEL